MILGIQKWKQYFFLTCQKYRALKSNILNSHGVYLCRQKKEGLYFKYLKSISSLDSQAISKQLFQSKTNPIQRKRSSPIRNCLSYSYHFTVWPQEFVTNTTAASKYIPRRPRISISWNLPFRTQIYLVNSKR